MLYRCLISQIKVYCKSKSSCVQSATAHTQDRCALFDEMTKKVTYILILVLFNSCFVVNHKKDVLNKIERGDPNKEIKLNGYYYREFEQKAFPFYKNEYGGFSENKAEPYEQN